MNKRSDKKAFVLVDAHGVQLFPCRVLDRFDDDHTLIVDIVTGETTMLRLDSSYRLVSTRAEWWHE